MADSGYDQDYIIDMLCRGGPLPPRYKNHKLKGDMKGYMECHIGFDRVLVYRYDGDDPILYAVDTGTHMDVSGNRTLRWSSEQSRQVLDRFLRIAYHRIERRIPPVRLVAVVAPSDDRGSGFDFVLVEGQHRS